ncbi:MAG: translation initiation factor IF-2 [Candidatus Eiseniibacteriota bacterium]|nr:MAG: translation initiation factor IF-2 [Candidatus Eisenbacteria bacterium]
MEVAFLGKRRVYEVAKELNISSVALLEVVRGFGIRVKSHMSTLDSEAVEKVRKKFEKEKQAVKEEYARKMEKRAARLETVAKKPVPKVAKKPPEKKLRARVPRRKRVVDEKAVRESVKRTLAGMDVSRVRRRRRRAEEGEEAVAEEAKLIKVSEYLTVAELATRLGRKPNEVLASCLELGLMVNVNMRLDRDSIVAVADEFGFEVEFVSEYGSELIEEPTAPAAELVARAPVVTIMGHVDHGKTSLLDYIRRSNVIAGEMGGITQHIGAYEVELEGGRVTFLDTPGHEAFTAMRARGAQATDIVVIVVAADDMVMPQTIEAIDHAKAAGVPIIVAINKMDLPGVKSELVKQELTKAGVVVEDWGGTTVCVEISAKTGIGVDRLLEMILLQAELLELKADAVRRARGVVIEAKVEQGRGIVATILVQEGTLRIGDPFVSGLFYGRVRAMCNERGDRVREAGPSTPVEVLGWTGTPQAGDSFAVTRDDREAREIAVKRQQLHREHEYRLRRHMTLSDLYDEIKRGANELRLIVKGDVGGSVEALCDALAGIRSEEVKLNIIHRGVGTVNESDVLLAAASDAVIIGFGVRAEPGANELREREGVDVRLYKVIYEAVEDIKKAMSGLLKPERKETVIGSAEVREVFRLSKVGAIAGSFVTSGTIRRNARVRLLRDGEVLFDGLIRSLKRFKEDVREVSAGFECGIGLEGFENIEVKDVLQAYTVEEVARTI